MGRLAKIPVSIEDTILVSEDASSNLLSLAAHIALEVGLVTGPVTHVYTQPYTLQSYLSMLHLICSV